MRATTLAGMERHLREFAVYLPPELVVAGYSKGRLGFLEKFAQDIPQKEYSPPELFSRVLWGLKFQAPLMNAAGMFKNGEAYDVVSRQGAGGYLGGTGTYGPWLGNMGMVKWKKHIIRLSEIDDEREMQFYLKNGIYLPFAPYPRSHSSSNCLGLPGKGDHINSVKAARIKKIPGCPVGWSLMGSPGLDGEEKLKGLIDGMTLYELAGVDFLEINESCPNTSHGKPQDDDLFNRLKYIHSNFLQKKSRDLPVIVKFSNDTELEQVPLLLDMLFELNFDGVNFGNTSTNYAKMEKYIDEKEKKLYDFFTQTFGGGVSGRPLKESSLELAGRAVEYVRARSPAQEFHVIRTGGVESIEDIIDSERAGVSLNQWFTGYFDNFARHGHQVYSKMF